MSSSSSSEEEYTSADLKIFSVKASSTSPAPISSPSSSSSSIPAIGFVGIAFAAVLAVSVVITLLICLCFCDNKKKRRGPPPFYPQAYHGDPSLQYPDAYYTPGKWNVPAGKAPPSPPQFVSLASKDSSDAAKLKNNLGFTKTIFNYEQLAVATAGFSKGNLLGEGGFGCVYKGTLISGQNIAVKQLKVGAEQGEKEFRAEVDIISRVHHRHLVSLVGYCISDSQRLLVYDYVPNGNLDYHLHGKGRTILDWPTRIKIALGAAKGLTYLHEDCHPKIIHRDIKSSNILLDENFNAQVSDFGLAKLASDANTHVTTRVVGTFGYLAPEYASSGKLTEKSDIFSFGVVLLELVTGRKPVDMTQSAGEESLVEWARPLLMNMNKEEDLELIADPFLNGVYNRNEMLQMVQVAAACVRHSAPKRPRMGQATVEVLVDTDANLYIVHAANRVLRALEDEVSLTDLNQGVKPGHSSVYYGSSFASTDYDSASYNMDLKKLRHAAFGSHDCSSEYSGAASDYGMHRSTTSSSEF